MKGKRRFDRGFYLLPTMFTVGNLLCGFYSIVSAFHGEIARAALLIIIAGVLDLFDGRIARLTGTTSEFGSEFDSLADIVSFGISPAMLSYAWVLQPYRRFGLFVAFVFVVCAAMRLARFNIQANASEKRHFVGLSSPVAAASLASVIYTAPDAMARGSVGSLLEVALVATLGLLMISRFRYRSFKDFALTSRRPYVYVLPLAIVLVAIGMWPRFALPGLASIYILSAPGLSLLQLLGLTERRTKRQKEVVDEPIQRG